MPYRQLKRICRILLVIAVPVWAAGITGCPVGPTPGNDNGNTNTNANVNSNGNDNGSEPPPGDPIPDDNANANVNDNGDDGNVNGNDNGSEPPPGNGNDNANVNDNGNVNENDNGNANDNGNTNNNGNDNGSNPPPVGNQDDDGDGVTNERDVCPGTPAGTTVGPNGCPPAVCGNGTVEAPEQCDPPDDTTCNDDCRFIPNEDLTNDGCATPIQIAAAITPFDSRGATTDGPHEGGLCSVVDLQSDVWFCYEADCAGFVTVSLCASMYDTTLAVYSGCACPTAAALGCSDDDCGTGTGSQLTVPARLGDSFLVRVGGFADAQGDGSVAITCSGERPDTGSPCGTTTGGCLSQHRDPGCNEESCCRAVCTADPFCCDQQEGEWDDLCVCAAAGICGGQFGACTNNTSPCNSAHGEPGCNDQDCCQDVCAFDPFCCCVEWDELCAQDGAACR